MAKKTERRLTFVEDVGEMVEVGSTTVDNVEEECPSSSPRRRLTLFKTDAKVELANLILKLERWCVCIEGDIDRVGFRKLWEILFPRSNDLADSECVFADIDSDGSGVIDVSELAAYINYAAALTNTLEPDTIREWVWVMWGFKGSRYNGSRTWAIILSVSLRILSQVAIVTSLVVLMVETIPEAQNFNSQPGYPATWALEGICVAIFTVEFLSYCATYVKKGDSDRTCKNLWTDMGTWVDLITILPYYTSLLEVNVSESEALVSLRVVRVLVRSFRVVKVLQLGKASCLTMLGLALKRSAPFLWWLVLVLVMVMALTSSFMFYAERGGSSFNHETRYWIRHDNSSYSDAGERIAFQSIPETLWWSIVTITSVGYGDQVPVTPVGKLVGGMTMLTGMIVVGFPVTILTGAFQELLVEDQVRQRRNHLCMLFVEALRFAALDEHRKSIIDMPRTLLPSTCDAVSHSTSPAASLSGSPKHGKVNCPYPSPNNGPPVDFEALLFQCTKTVTEKIDTVAALSSRRIAAVEGRLAGIEAALYEISKTCRDKTLERKRQVLSPATSPLAQSCDTSYARFAPVTSPTRSRSSVATDFI